MASVSVRRLVQRSTSYTKSFIGSSSPPRSITPTSATSGPSKFAGVGPSFPSPAPRLSRQNVFFTSRLPKELAGGESLMPLHSVTASALLKSLLSSDVGQWSSLSEGFATPL